MSWLISKALMNSLCSPEQVVEFLGENCSDGEQSALSSGNHTQQAYCAPDKMTDFSRLSRFGMTYKPLTENLGKELLTWYLAAFPAKTSVLPEKAQELTVNGQECGEKWHASFAKYDPVTHSLRTHQCSLFEDSTESCATLPKWGLMLAGECWEQQTLEQTISAKGSGSLLRMWPTPVASMYKGSSQNSLTRKNGRSRENDRLDHAVMASDGGHLNPTWTEWLMGFPLGWTDLRPSVIHKSPCAQQKPSESLVQTCEI